MFVKYVMGRAKLCMALWTLASISFCSSDGAFAAITLDQMNSLKGAAQLEITVDQLFQSCGLPAAIVDHGSADNARQHINWRRTPMRLSAMDWNILYGIGQRKQQEMHGGWVNRRQSDAHCNFGLPQLLFHAKGNVGVLTVTKKAKGLGYITAYNVPKDPYKAHKVVSVETTLATSLPVSELVGLYGHPDEVLKQAGDIEDFRYWVVTHHGNMPDSLYAVDFEINNGICKTYAISTSDVDFVQRQLELLVRQWEKEYILD